MSTYSPQPAPLSPTAERQLCSAAHWSAVAAVLLGGITFMGPLIVLIAFGNRSPRVRAQAVDALNFQLTVWITALVVGLVSVPLFLFVIGFLTIWLVPLVLLLALVFHVVAAIKAADGVDYRYPFTLHLIK